MEMVELDASDIICTSGGQTYMYFSNDVGDCPDEALIDIWGKQW